MISAESADARTTGLSARLPLIKAADGGCDNVFEASSHGLSPVLGRVVTQCLIIGNNTYFLGHCPSRPKIIVEPDGRTKFGDNEQVHVRTLGSGSAASTTWHNAWAGGPRTLAR